MAASPTLILMTANLDMIDEKDELASEVIRLDMK